MIIVITNSYFSWYCSVSPDSPSSGMWVVTPLESVTHRCTDLVRSTGLDATNKPRQVGFIQTILSGKAAVILSGKAAVILSGKAAVAQWCSGAVAIPSYPRLSQPEFQSCSAVCQTFGPDYRHWWIFVYEWSSSIYRSTSWETPTSLFAAKSYLNK